MIRPVAAQDLPALCAIYNHYITDTVVSFEETPIAGVRQAGLPWLVAEANGEIAGYAYAGRWKERSAYRFCVEISVYLAHTQTGKGLGTRLYEALFAELRATSARVVIGGIALPNPASIALHEKFGMRKVSHYPGVGYKFGRWIDVAYWQCELGPPA